MKLVSYNIKNKSKYPGKQSNSRKFICNAHTSFSESLLQCDCFRRLKTRTIN